MVPVLAEAGENPFKLGSCLSRLCFHAIEASHANDAVSRVDLQFASARFRLELTRAPRISSLLAASLSLNDGFDEDSDHQRNRPSN